MRRLGPEPPSRFFRGLLIAAPIAVVLWLLIALAVRAAVAGY